MYPVSVIRGNQQRSGESSLSGFAGLCDSLQYIPEKSSFSPCSRCAANLFVIVTNQQAGKLCFRIHEAGHASETAQQVVESSTGNKLPSFADQRRWIGVIKAEVCCQDLLVIDLWAYQVLNAVAILCLQQQGCHIRFRVNLSIVIGFTIQVYGQAGNDRYGAFQVDQGIPQFAVGGFIGYSTSEAEVSIKPRIQQNASVHLDTQLVIAVLVPVRMRFYFEAGAVRVRPHHPDAGIGHIGGANDERDD